MDIQIVQARLRDRLTTTFDELGWSWDRADPPEAVDFPIHMPDLLNEPMVAHLPLTDAEFGPDGGISLRLNFWASRSMLREHLSSCLSLAATHLVWLLVPQTLVDQAADRTRVTLVARVPEVALTAPNLSDAAGRLILAMSDIAPQICSSE